MPASLLRVVASTRILIECALVELIQRRAIQRGSDRIDELRNQSNDWPDVTHNTLQSIRDTLLRSLESEAKGIVALKKCLRSINIPRDVADVGTDEAVRCAGVSAYTDDGGVSCCEDGNVSLGLVSASLF